MSLDIMYGVAMYIMGLATGLVAIYKPYLTKAQELNVKIIVLNELMKFLKRGRRGK